MIIISGFNLSAVATRFIDLTAQKWILISFIINFRSRRHLARRFLVTSVALSPPRSASPGGGPRAPTSASPPRPPPMATVTRQTARRFPRQSVSRSQFRSADTNKTGGLHPSFISKSQPHSPTVNMYLIFIYLFPAEIIKSLIL